MTITLKEMHQELKCVIQKDSHTLYQRESEARVGGFGGKPRQVRGKRENN